MTLRKLGNTERRSRFGGEGQNDNRLRFDYILFEVSDIHTYGDVQ